MLVDLTEESEIVLLSSTSFSLLNYKNSVMVAALDAVAWNGGILGNVT